MKPARLAAVAAATTALLVGSLLPAAAVTGGDRDGEAHPAVGLLAFTTPGGGRGTCTGTLVTDRVVLTAGHCTAAAVGEVGVTFDAVVAEAPPLPLPVAADPEQGYTTAELDAAGLLPGTAHTHPGIDVDGAKRANDVGVVVLAEPVAGTEPARIAPAGYLDRFSPDVLHDTLFTEVGYGAHVTTAPSGSQRPTPVPYPLARRSAQSPGQKLTDQVLQVNGNDKDPRGTGGTCLGDSGGPAFHDGYEVAVASYVLTPNCRWIAGLQRVDVPVVQGWLAGFGVGAAA